ncbi:MAG: hypothetical protein IPK08_19295 [Bacteroidetes bacterium]|nr:hypothetical protein [Bacteroidota bacterium]
MESGNSYDWLHLGAYSRNKCWDVNLNGFYGSNAKCYIYSPAFDFTNVTIANISFWTFYRTESLWDYLSVQSSTDNGDTWNFMPFPGLIDPDGATKKWIQSSLSVSDLNGYSSVTAPKSIPIPTPKPKSHHSSPAPIWYPIRLMMRLFLRD